MVVKAIINALGKGVPKPKKFPPGSEFKKTESETLLQDAQKKVEKIEAKELKPVDTTKYFEDPDANLFIPGSYVAPTLTPQKVFNKKVKAPRSTKQEVDNFITEEQKILNNADLSPVKQLDDFNINTFQTSDDVLRSIQTISKQYKDDIKTRKRDVVTWKETNELAELLGDNAETLTGNLLKLRPGSALNATEIKAAKNLLIYNHKKLTALGKRLQTEEASDTLALEFARQHAVTAQLTKVFKGAQTEIARALNILKEPTQEGAIRNLDLDALNRNNILMQVGGKETIQAVADLYLRTPTLSKKIAFAEKSILARTSDAAVEMFLNNILVGILTHVKNVGGNFIFKSIQRAERRYASKVYGGKTVDSVAEFEADAAAFGEHMAATNMFRAFSQDFKKLSIFKPINSYRNFPTINSNIAGTKFEAPPNAFSADGFGLEKNTKLKSVLGKAIDVLGRILTFDRIPYRFLQGADNYFKNRAYQAELYALAYRETLKLVKTNGIPKEKAADVLASLITNPPDFITKAAYDNALELTFQTPLSKRNDAVGDLTNIVSKLKNEKVLNPITIITSQWFPFLRTPGNIVGSSIERMPFLGANRILRSYKEQLRKGGAEAELAKAKAATGWAFMATFVPLGYFGIFGGSDVAKYNGREGYLLKQASGKQPKSFRIHNFLNEKAPQVAELTGLTGSKLQLSLNGFEPAVLLASTAADVGAIIAELEDDWRGYDTDKVKMLLDFLSAYALSFGENILNSSVLYGSSRLIDMISQLKMSEDKGQVAKEYGKKLGASVFPFQTFLNQFEDLGQDEIETRKFGIVNRDDFVKLNIEFKSMIQKNFPGFENDLPLNYDWLGDERTKFSVFSTYTEDPVNEEAAKIDYFPTPVRKKLIVSVEGVNTKFGEIPYPIQVAVPLKNKEYSLYQFNTNKRIRLALTDLINRDSYKKITDKVEKKDLFAEEVRAVKTEVTDLFKSEANPYYNDIMQRAMKLALKKWSEENKLNAEPEE